MQDPSVNFYEVVAAAEAYFETIEIQKKGSGYKGYMRWKMANEYKYYPSGDRSQTDPYFVEKAYQAFQRHPKTQSSSFREKMGSTWTELGPVSIETITGHYAPGMGRVEDFYVDPNNDNILYIGSRSGGFWKSLDGGETWTGNTADFLMATGVNSIAVDPLNNQNVFISLRNARNGTSHGVYRSTTGGDNWIPTNFNPTNLGQGGLGSNFRINTLVAHPQVPNLFFVGTNRGIYKTTDSFQTWTQLFNLNVSGIDFHSTDDQIVYFTAYGANVIYRSTDQGNSYTPSNEITGNNNRSGTISVTPACNECVYFGSANGVWKSTDNGLTFSLLGTPNLGCGNGFAVSDTDSNQILNACVDIEMSSDEGQSFTQRTYWWLGNVANGTGSLTQNFQTTTKYVHADIRNARCINGVFYVSTDGYLAKSSDNGLNWKLLSETVGIRENYKLGVSQNNNSRTIVGSQDNGTSLLTENGWVEYYGADGMEGIIHPLNDDYMIGSIQFGSRVRSRDGGLTRDLISPDNESGNGNADWEAPLAFDPNDQLKVFHFSSKIFESNDFGENWILRGTPSSFTGSIQHAEIAQNNSNIMLISRGSSLEKSTNAGSSFINISANLPNSSIKDIAFDPLDDDTIYVVYANYQNDGKKVYESKDGGLTWNNITYNLGNMPVHTVVVDHDDASNIYLGTELGVFTKPAAGNTWTTLGTGLPNVSVEELEIVYATNTLKASTWGRGLWETKLVGRANYPAINYTTITNPPTELTPYTSQDQYVTSEISYDGTLSGVEVRWSFNNLNFNNIIPMTNTAGDTWESNTPIPSGQVSDKVYFKVVATTSTGKKTETYKFMYRHILTEYCEASGTSRTGADYINNVTLENLTTNTTVFSNNSGKNIYTLYYDNAPPTLEIGDRYRITMTLDYAFSPDRGRGWIDFDGNRVFSADELVMLTGYVNNTGTAEFVVPDHAVQNQSVRLRVRNNYYSPDSPCGTTAGEVEDYLLNFDDVAISNKSILTQGVNIYPNPFGQTFTVQSTGALKIYAYDIYDLQGRLIQSKEVSGLDQFNVDLSGAASQMYWISLRTDGGSSVHQLIKK